VRSAGLYCRGDYVSELTHVDLFSGEKMMNKKCSKCRLIKPIEDFYKDKRAMDGRSSQCKKCKDKMTAKWRSTHLSNRAEYHKNYRELKRDRLNETARRHHYLRRYGMTKEEALALTKLAGGKCQICGDRFSKENPAHIDHDHNTGIVRGVLCRCCNSGLGLFKDSPDVLKLAVEYLK